MKQMHTKKLFGAFMANAMLLLAGTSNAYAGSLNQNIALGGSIAPVPVTCSFTGGDKTVSINEAASAGTIASQYFLYKVQCNKANFPIIVSSTSQWMPITIGGEAAGAALLNSIGYNLFSSPDYLTTFANGASANWEAQVKIGGASFNTNLDPTKHVGAVVGALQLSVSY